MNLDRLDQCKLFTVRGGRRSSCAKIPTHPTQRVSLDYRLAHWDSADYYMSEKTQNQQREGAVEGGSNATPPLMAAEIRALEARMQQKSSTAVDDDDFLPKPFAFSRFDSADHFMEEKKASINAEGFEKEPIDNRLNGFRLGSQAAATTTAEVGGVEQKGHKAAASFLFKKLNKRG